MQVSNLFGKQDTDLIELTFITRIAEIVEDKEFAKKVNAYLNGIRLPYGIEMASLENIKSSGESLMMSKVIKSLIEDQDYQHTKTNVFVLAVLPELAKFKFTSVIKEEGNLGLYNTLKEVTIEGLAGQSSHQSNQLLNPLSVYQSMYVFKYYRHVLKNLTESEAICLDVK